MIGNLRSRGLLPSVIAGVLGVALLGGGALAITDTTFRYSTPKTGHYGISYLTMTPTSSTTNYSSSATTGLSTTSASGCFSTGVSLPHGATITGLTVWYGSTSASTPTVYFLRHKSSDGAVNTISYTSFRSSGGARKSATLPVSPNYVEVNNVGYTYAFVVCLSPGDYFYAGRIPDTYTNAGD